MQILALDVGTSSVKAAVLDTATSNPVRAIARTTYELRHPTPDAAEIAPDVLWQAVAAAAREAAAGQRVDGIGFSVLTPALVLLDAGDRPVAPIWTHLDRRARPAARDVWAEVGDEFLATTGNRPLPGGITALCWRQQLHDDSSLRRRVRHYLHVNGWLVLRLTGARAFDRGNACFTGLFGTLTDRQWSERWIGYFDLDPAWLPPVLCGSTTVGVLRPEAAAELGVPAGTPVKLGTADTSTAMLAAEMRHGDLLHVVGTTQVLAVLTNDPRPDPRRLTRFLGVGSDYIRVTHNPVGGVGLDWLRELCFRDQSADEFYTKSIPAADRRTPSVVLDPPFLGGDRLEIEAKRAGFRELTLATERLDLLAAVLHAMREQHAKALATLGMGTSFARVFLTGGGAEVVRGLIPHYTGGNVHFLHEGSLRGVARLFQE
jgi:sugar (pentulose or hexulose) kinase